MTMLPCAFIYGKNVVKILMSSTMLPGWSNVARSHTATCSSWNWCTDVILSKYRTVLNWMKINDSFLKNVWCTVCRFQCTAPRFYLNNTKYYLILEAKKSNKKYIYIPGLPWLVPSKDYTKRTRGTLAGAWNVHCQDEENKRLTSLWLFTLFHGPSTPVGILFEWSTHVCNRTQKCLLFKASFVCNGFESNPNCSLSIAANTI